MLRLILRVKNYLAQYVEKFYHGRVMKKMVDLKCAVDAIQGFAVAAIQCRHALEACGWEYFRVALVEVLGKEHADRELSALQEMRKQSTDPYFLRKELQRAAREGADYHACRQVQRD